MIKIGIVGLGNVAWNVHLPILLSREDVGISWICDKNLEKKSIVEEKKIKFFSNIDEISKFENVDIILLTVPYGERSEIFDKLKNKCSGIFFEKPYALNLKEHNYFTDCFKSACMTVGYTRRKMGIVQTIKRIIEEKIFGELISVNIFFGDIHYKFDSFRSDIKKSGGGIFFEAGTHWIDCVLFTSGAKQILNFESEKKFKSGLDIESNGRFELVNKTDKKIKCNFEISVLKNTANKIQYNFNNCSVDLFLFKDDSNLKIKNKGNFEFLIKDNDILNFPNDSYSVAYSFWNEFISSFINKKESEFTINSFFLTTKITEMFYGK